MEKQDHFDGPEVTVDMLMCPLNSGYKGKEHRDIRVLPINFLWWATDHPTVAEHPITSFIWWLLADQNHHNPLLQFAKKFPWFNWMWEYAQDCDGSITCSWCTRRGVDMTAEQIYCDDCVRRL